MAECDICAKRPSVARVLVCGIETSVCAVCRGDDEESEPTAGRPEALEVARVRVANPE